MEKLEEANGNWGFTFSRMRRSSKTLPEVSTGRSTLPPCLRTGRMWSVNWLSFCLLLEGSVVRDRSESVIRRAGRTNC